MEEDDSLLVISDSEPETTTSKFFPPVSPSNSRARKRKSSFNDAEDVNAHTRNASASSSKSLQTGETSDAGRSAKRRSVDVEERASQAASSPGFQSARELLLLSQSQSGESGLDEEDPVSKKKKKTATAKGKAKATEPPKSKRKQKSKLSISSISSVEIIEETTASTSEAVTTKSYRKPKIKAQSVPIPEVALPPRRRKTSAPVASTSTAIPPVELSDEEDGLTANERLVLKTRATTEELTTVTTLKSSIAQFAFSKSSSRVSSASSSESLSVETSRPKPQPRKLPSTLMSKSKSRQTTLTDSTPLELPQPRFISALATCPICSTPFLANKTAASRSTHLRSCASSSDTPSSSLTILIENQILSLAEVSERARREKEENRSFFDRVVGVGEGMAKGKGREVEVVGCEKGNIRDMQEEFKDFRRKIPVEKLVKLANEIKDKQAKIKAEEQLAKGKQRDEDEVENEMPRPTGMLVPHMGTQTRLDDRARAMDVLDEMTGTGLTQAPAMPRAKEKVEPPPPETPALVDTAIASDVEETQDKEEEPLFDLEPLRSTQEFPTSKLAKRKSSSIEVVHLPNKFGVEPLRASNSLWTVSDGLNDERIRQSVVTDRSSDLSPKTTESPQVQMRATSRGFDSPLATPSTKKDPIGPFEVRCTTPPALEVDAFRRTMNSMTPQMATPEKKVKVEAKQSLDSPGLTTRLSGLLLEDGSFAEGGGGGGLEWQEEQMDDAWQDVGEEEWGDGVLMWDGGEVEGMLSTEGMIAAIGEPDTPIKKRRKKSVSPPLTPSPAKTKSKAKSRVRKSTSTSSDDEDGAISSPAEDDLTRTPPPEYATWTVAALQKEVGKYGYRPSKERDVLEIQLVQVWEAMHPLHPPKKKKGKARAKSPKSKTREGKVKVARKPRKKAADVDDDTGETEEGLVEKLRKAIQHDVVLYSRVLRYEPIYFEEISSLVVASGIKASRVALVSALDELCVSFYTEDPTAGRRARRK